MKEILQQLANLQYIDSRIDEIKQLRGDLPEKILDIEIDIARNEHKFTSEMCVNLELYNTAKISAQF